MYVNEYSFRVRYAETDQMGIVYHANYYIWFDMGRTELMRSIGYDYSELEKQGLLLPVLETHCYYKKAAKYDDILTIKTKIGEIKGVRIMFKYEVYDQDNNMVAYGSTSQAFVNRSLKPINVKKAFPEVYEKLTSCL